MKRHKTRRILLMILAGVIVIFSLYISGSSYIKSLPALEYKYGNLSGENVSYPDARFAVISDLHYYDVSLGTSGKAYEACLKSDRKLLAESAYIIGKAIDNILGSDVKLVLVSGDLTKDGELLNHQKVIEQLSRLTEKGIKVLVIPGNHDVNNPGAVKYIGAGSTRVPNISGSQFAEMYGAFGYNDAIARDKNTLSYVSEPVSGLWVVALDTCRSRENIPGQEEIYSGILLQSQVDWLEEMLDRANSEGKAVIILQHHGVVEHWPGQSKLHPEYILPDYKHVGRLYSSYGVRIAITGHYHSQDVTYGSFKDNGYLYDIETGSLSTPPCPVRYCTISGSKLTLSREALIDKLYPGTDFAEKGKKFVHENVSSEAYFKLREYKVTSKDAKKIADLVGSGFVAHNYGDENPAERPTFNPASLGIWSRVVYATQKYVMDGLWKDLSPADNNVTLDLNR